jgi:rhodanese-related sulfurtransferase
MNKLLEFVTTNPLLVTATFLMLVAVLLFELRMRTRANFEVSIIEAIRMMNGGAVVVDVRDKAQYDGGHIVDSLHILPTDIAKADERRLKKKRAVVVVCDTGSESHRCARALREAGFEGAFSLSGGLSAWQRDNQPLVASRR